MISLWKPSKGSHKRAKKREDAKHDRERRKVRHKVWIRDEQRCRCCGAHVELKSDSLFRLAHIHEIKYRSRGGDDLDPRNLITLCGECHLYGEHHQTADVRQWIDIVIVNEIDGANDENGIQFKPWQPERAA